MNDFINKNKIYILPSILLVLNIIIAIIYNICFNSMLKLLYNKFKSIRRNKKCMTI